jgi:hypothetical protein
MDDRGVLLSAWSLNVPRLIWFAVKKRAATIARDVTVAVAGAMQNPTLGTPQSAATFAEGLVKVYEAIHAAALKSIKE